MKSLLSMITLVLLAVSPAQGEGTDSLQLFLQQGDSCMRQYNTFDALRYYQRAFNYAEAQNVVQFLASTYLRTGFPVRSD